MSDKRVIINGVTQLYEYKAPYTSSGKSILGALEFDADSERVKCHECGEWFEHLGSHVSQTHGMYAKAYKRRHGLRIQSALCSEGVRLKLRLLMAKNRQSGKCFNGSALQLRKSKKARNHRRKLTAEGINNRRACIPQTLRDVRQLAKSLNRTPSDSDLKRIGLSLAILRTRFGSVKRAMRLANVAYRKRGYQVSSRQRYYSPEGLIAHIKNFIQNNNRIPSQSDCNRGLLPSHTTFVRHFGAFTKAVTAAGFTPYSANGWNGYHEQRRQKLDPQRVYRQTAVAANG